MSKPKSNRVATNNCDSVRRLALVSTLPRQQLVTVRRRRPVRGDRKSDADRVESRHSAKDHMPEEVFGNDLLGVQLGAIGNPPLTN